MFGPGTPSFALRQGTVYGIRPHRDFSDEEMAAIIRTPAPFSHEEVVSTFGFTIGPLSRQQVEVMFHYCLECDSDVESCTCHDEGKGNQ